MAALASFYILDLQLVNVSLFCLSSGTFLYFRMVTALKKRSSFAKLEQVDYSGQSFCKRVAHHVANHDMLDEMIQKLDQWTCNIF